MRRAGLVLAALALMVTGCPDENIVAYDTPPTVEIQSPSDGSVIEGPDDAIEFVGVVVDQQDVGDEISITWSADTLDEPFYEGNPDSEGLTETAAILGAGIHIVTLEATDTWGNTASDFITVEVDDYPVGPATVVINEPQPAYIYYYLDPILFSGEVTGAHGDRVLFVEWSSGIDGTLYTNQSDTDGITQFEGYLSPGIHVIQLAAGYDFDPDIGVGYASVTVQIGEQPPGELDQDGDGYCPDGIDLDGDGECDSKELTGAGSQDCNDFDPAVYPGAPEICDGQDTDCDGHMDVDEMDQDGDGQSPCGGDCDDANPANYTGNAEICDGMDNDCDELVDDDDPGVVGQQTWFQDADGDGFGDPTVSYTECFQPADTCNNPQDCDDTNPDVNPAQTEVCDGVDNNCNGNVDEGFDLDADGYTTCAGDCDDGDPTVYPGATEVCDELDNDCDGLVNEDWADSYEMWETGPSDTGYELSSINPTLGLGGGSCSFTVVLIIPWTFNLLPGTGSVSGNFHSPDDQWDIYTFNTDLTTNLAEWAAFLASGQTLPASCTSGTVSFTSNHQTMMTVYVDGMPYSQTGYSGSVNFNLSLWDLFDIDYEVVVEPMGTWIDCNHTYTLSFEIP